jgi:chromosome partitioning protein
MTEGWDQQTGGAEAPETPGTAAAVNLVPAGALPPAPAPSTRPPEPQVAAAHTSVIAIGNQKGGVGKTTTVVNLAAGLAERGYWILVIDLDPQANATSGLGLAKQQGTSMYGPLLGQGTAADLIQETVVHNVNIIPSELDLAGSEVDVARMEGYLHCFQRALQPVVAANAYDFILIDCPPSLGILTMNALAAAQSMIVPIQCEYYALEGLSVIVNLVDQLREGGANPALHIEGVLMTMYDGRTNLSAQVVNEVRTHFPEPLYETIIPRNVRLSEAPSYGRPVTQYDPSSRGAKAYRALAEEFLTRRGLTKEDPHPGQDEPAGV